MPPRGPLPSRERQRARRGRAADGPATGVVEPGGVAGRRGGAQGLAPGVVVPNAAVAVGRSGADAPALRVIEPSLRLGACLTDRDADDDCDQNSKKRYIGLTHCSLSSDLVRKCTDGGPSATIWLPVGRFAPRTGLVISRQRFVHRCQAPM